MKHNKDCELGINWKECPVCIDHHKETCEDKQCSFCKHWKADAKVAARQAKKTALDWMKSRADFIGWKEFINEVVETKDEHFLSLIGDLVERELNDKRGN